MTPQRSWRESIDEVVNRQNIRPRQLGSIQPTMENWYWDINEIKNSPSSKIGIDNATETRYRTEGSKFISTVGQQLKLRYITLATGTVYYHRFYMYHSFKEFHRYAIATACLFLAGKVEETPKKARDLFKQIQASGLITEQAMSSVFGDDPKEALMTLERILLKTIKFDLQVDHPYKFMLKYAKSFVGDRSKIEKVVQMGWTFINDSLCTTLCLQWEPEIVAIALMDLSCRISKHEISDWNGKTEGYKGKWWDQFVADVSMELLESICHQVLDFYSTAAPSQQARPSSVASSSRGSGPETGSKRAADSTVASSSQPSAKIARTDQVVSQALPPQAVVVNPGAPVVSSQPPVYPPTAMPVVYHQPPSVYPPQNLPPNVAPTTMTSQPAYPAPPPGYPTQYSAPPPQIPSHMHQPPPPGVPSYQHQAQHYYSQPPAIMPQQPAYYSQSAGAPPAPVVYQQLPPHVYHAPPQQQRRERMSTLKVLTDHQ